MSFLNSELENQLTARFKKVLADEYYVKDPETGNFIPLTGSGDDLELPYWIQNNSANFDNSIKNTKIDIDGVEVNNQNKGTFLSEDKLTFGDSTGNVSLEKSDVQMLKELQTIGYTNPAHASKMFIYNSATNRYASTIWRNYLDPASIQIPNPSTPLTRLMQDGLTIRNSMEALGTNISVSSQNITLGNRDAVGFTISNTKPRGVFSADYLRMYGINEGIYTSLTNNGLEMRMGIDIASLTLPMLQDLEKFNLKAQETATGADRLVAYNPGTKDYKLIETPSGGEPLPAYIQPENIEFSTPFQNHKISFNETSLVDKTGKNITSISSGQINVGRSDETDTSIDSDYPNISMDYTGKISFHDGNYDISSIDFSKARTLERLNAATTTTNLSNSEMIIYNNSTSQYHKAAIPTSNPTTYYFRVPDYTGIFANDVYTRNSWFPRLSRIGTPENPRENIYNSAIGSFDGPIPNPVRNFNINVGDSLILDFTQTVGGQPDDASAFFDTWYVLNISSSTGTKKIIEATLLNSQMNSDVYPEFVDIKTTVSGEVRFRFNGFTTEGETTKVLKKTIRDPFRGKLKLTLLSDDYDTLPTPTVNYS